MVTEFQKKVYELCKKVPKGKVTTYKILAEKLGTKAYRAIGSALNKNPYGIMKIRLKVGFSGHWEMLCISGVPEIEDFRACRKSERFSCILNYKDKKMVPCHRVVGSDGSLGGFAYGLKKKAKLLSKEGIQVKNNKIINFEKFLSRL